MSLERHYDWIFLYWMPYDNDMSRFATLITNMLKQGVRTTGILVAVEADTAGAGALTWSVITKGHMEVQELDTKDSASESAFIEYLDWARTNYSANKWAIVFLGHGGRLDEISPDQNSGSSTGAGGEYKWLRIEGLSEVISNFNKEVAAMWNCSFYRTAARVLLKRIIRSETPQNILCPHQP